GSAVEEVSWRATPSATGRSRSCRGPASGGVSAITHRPSGENLPWVALLKRTASPPSTGRIHVPTVFSVAPESEKRTSFPSGETSEMCEVPSQESSLGGDPKRRTTRAVPPAAEASRQRRPESDTS